ncbi:MAG: OsmC family protein [Actinomycetaceae bacterium]|nr:OsmC family protein [Actinomycetaceae bacterium]
MSKRNYLWLERTGTGSFVGKSSNGVSIPIGHGENELTPGDLLQLALAGCNATSSDSRFAAALGEDYESTIGVEGKYDKAEDRYTHMIIEIITDMSGLSDEERAKLETRARRAIDQRCTVGHTLNAGMTNEVVITSESEDLD